MKQEKVKFLPDWLPFLIDGYSVEVFFPSTYAPEEFVETKPDAIEQALMATYKKANDRLCKTFVGCCVLTGVRPRSRHSLVYLDNRTSQSCAPPSHKEKGTVHHGK